MNMRSFAALVGAFTAVGLVASSFSACVIAPCTGANCGFGGSGSGGGTSVSSTSVSSSSTSTSVSSSGSGVACDPMLTCQAAITPPDSPDKLCPGAEKDAYDALHKCECDATGKCGAACAAVDPGCKGMPMAPPVGPCQTCLQDTMAGCGNEFSTCNM